ncbi:MAG: zinc-dependent dehydrogenase [Candidatus Omnitrophica bacterium]|nr:zinc-dependent dehydrogenase [Candidatus Omnitrophota bacterium]
MKAAIFYGIEDIRVEQIEEPVCGKNEIKIKVEYCAICGTDVRIFYSGHKKVVPPAIIGHEITGIVAEIGENVEYSDLKVGDKVTVVTSIGCGKCKMCKGGFYNLCPDTKAIGYFYKGGFAEYLVIPQEAVKQKAVLKLPENLSLLEGTIIEPLSCCINGQNYLNIKKDDFVLIFGGGPIGFMHACLAKAIGCEKVVIVDPAFDRLVKFGKNFSDIILWDLNKINLKQEIMEITNGFGADVIITACPAKKAQIDSFDLIGSKGRISFFGGLSKDDSIIQIDSNIIHYKEISVFGAFASNRNDYIKAAELISCGKVDAKKFITDVIPLENIVEGIKKIKKGEGLKIVIKI